MYYCHFTVYAIRDLPEMNLIMNLINSAMWIQFSSNVDEEEISDGLWTWEMVL